MSFQKIQRRPNGTLLINNVIYTKEDIFDLYVSQNKSQNEMCKLFAVSRCSLIKLLNELDISKDPEVVKENRKKAISDKYGVSSAMLVPEFQKKAQATTLERYGHFCSLVNPEIKEKAKKTMKEKYGAEQPSQSSIIQEKKKAQYLDKYGVNTHWQRHIEHYDEWESVEKFKEVLIKLKKPSYAEVAEYFNVDRTAANYKVLQLRLEDLVSHNTSHSLPEDQIIEELRTRFGVIVPDNCKNVVGLLDSKQEIDIYLPQYHLGIEFNGWYWHSDVFHTDHGGRSTYHQQKSLQALQRGIFLFHIFEYEWNDSALREKIFERLGCILGKSSRKIGARECSIVPLSVKQKKDFLNKNHIQGNDKSKLFYGLRSGNEIVACMTFKTSKKSKYNWELSRFCCKSGCIVQGGASRLFKYFLSQHVAVGQTVVSFNDISKTKGDLYKTLGFQCVSINDPNYVWIKKFRGQFIIRSRYQEQASGERQRMHEAGYIRLCDCGTKTWVYTKGEK